MKITIQSLKATRLAEAALSNLKKVYEPLSERFKELFYQEKYDEYRNSWKYIFYLGTAPTPTETNQMWAKNDKLAISSKSSQEFLDTVHSIYMVEGAETARMVLSAAKYSVSMELTGEEIHALHYWANLNPDELLNKLLGSV